ncbi:MAG TPA: choice-of-anchor tandem repeat NxxGxxAF-containing protein [Candidatus Eisenbacteria bacterium]|jgi:hypothetical protein
MPLRNHVLTGAVCLALAAGHAHAAATVTVFPLARNGTSAPDANGSFGSFFSYRDPVLNDAGEAAFVGRFDFSALGSLDDDYLVRAGKDGTRTLLARQGQPLPDVTGTFGGLADALLREYAMNDSGRVAFIAPRTGTPGGSADNSAIYSIRDPGLFWVHARRGDTPPFTSTTFNGFFPPSINDQPPAAVSFFTSHGTGTAPVTVYTSRLGVLSPVAWLSRPAPDGGGTNGALSIFSYAGTGDAPGLRPNASEIAFYSHLSGTSTAPKDDDGMFRASPDVFVDMARGHQGAPGGGLYQEFECSPVYNANGVSSFLAQLEPVPSAGEIIALDWPFGGDVVAYTGQPAADGNGTFASLFEPSLNNHEAVAYRVRLAGTAGGALDDEAVYKGDSALVVVPKLEDQVAREGQDVPEGGGVFAGFYGFPAINDAGQVAFTATLRGTPGGASDDHGLYLWDPAQGRVKLLREGDLIGGRHVAQFVALNHRDYGGHRSLNSQGEVVVRIQFSEFGADGIYLFRLEPLLSAPPPPPPFLGPLALRVGPNPVRSGAVDVRWSAPRATEARVRVLDATGRLVRELVPGAGAARWALDDARGGRVAPGIYVVVLEAGGGCRARRVAVVR